MIVTGEAFLKLISLQIVSQLLMCEKKDKRETDQDKLEEEALDIAIYLSISPHYDSASISHYCCHSTQTKPKLLSSLFVMYAYFNKLW
jgi:hypothetical protein